MLAWRIFQLGVAINLGVIYNLLMSKPHTHSFDSASNWRLASQLVLCFVLVCVVVGLPSAHTLHHDSLIEPTDCPVYLLQSSWTSILGEGFAIAVIILCAVLLLRVVWSVVLPCCLSKAPPSSRAPPYYLSFSSN